MLGVPAVVRFLRSRFVVTTLLLFAVLATWALANPRYASPDEPSHVRKAAALVRGEFFGDRIQHGQPWQRMVDIPIAYGTGTGAPDIPGHPEQGGRAFVPCFAFNAARTADCQHFESKSGNSRFYTTASMYPPVYYSIVGLPTLVVNDANGVYVMRLVSALVVALLIASAFELLGALPYAPVARSVLLIGLTPMVVFTASSVNPIALEIAAALLLWTSGLVLTRPADAGAVRRRPRSRRSAPPVCSSC